jgi:ATP-binding cassette, subfamily B, multidrug efflux pump
LMHVQDFIHPLREILEKYQQLQNSLTSAERVFHLLEEVPEPSSLKTQVFGNSKKSGHIEIKNLNFKYESSLPLVLENIDLEIRPGESIAIVGRTGSGKTTLISLLQRFYEPPKNTIFIDNSPIENYNLQTLRSKIGVVQQDNFIFKGTVRDNVCVGDPKIPEQKIIQALDQVGYLKLLARSGRNLDSLIEEKGSNLSVGERQLIAFARILAFEPEILILDEATSNVDSETERIIQDATRTIIKNRTSIIIAHRLSTIEDCDRIITLQDGKIAQTSLHPQA